MASSRIIRLANEVAPPQFVSVMRQRARKMLDTIIEEERDVSTVAGLASFSSETPPSAACSVATGGNKFNYSRNLRTSFSNFSQ